MRRALCAAVVALALCVSALAADAQDLPRVSLGPVSGPHADDAARAVNAALIEHSDALELLPSSGYAQTAQRLGTPGSDAAEVARVARAMRLDAVVVVEMSRHGRGLLLRVRVLHGHDGSLSGVATWELRSAGDLDLVGAEYWDQLHSYFQVDPELRAAVTPLNTGDTGNAVGTNTASEAPTGEVQAAPAAAPTPGLGIVTGVLEAGGAMRSWRIPVLGEMSPRGYDNPGYAEGAAEVLGLYRLARDRFGIGASAAITFPISISSRESDAMGNVIPLSTSSIEVWGGLTAALRPLGGGLLRADVGAVTHSFNVDTTMLPLEERLSPMSYTGLRLAMQGALPVYASAHWEFDVLFGTELRATVVGADARAAFGQNASLALGLGGMAGLALRLDGLLQGLGVRFTAQMLRYRTTFAGPSTIGTGSDSVDDYFRFHFGVSYAFGTRLVAP